MTEKKSPRYVFIDLLRGLAVFVMIEVHVVNALLLPSLRTGNFFRFVNFINGLVAPSFIFIAGFAFSISTQRKLSNYLKWNSRPLFIQFRRLGLILLIGYLLHLPYFSFRKLVYDAPYSDWEKFFQADVLHCIATSLIFLQVALLILRKPSRVYIAAGLVGLCCIFLAPVVWTVDVGSYLPLPVAAYFNNMHYSLFPWFPWAGYLMLGSIAGHGFVLAIQNGDVATYMKRVAVVAGIMIVLGIMFNVLPVHLYPVYDFWHSSPEFFFVRLGMVLLILVLLWKGEVVYHYSGSFLTKFGQESLIVYTAHLMIIYGSALGDQSIASYVGKTQQWDVALLLSGVLIIIMIVLAYLWGWLKKDHHILLRIVQYAGTLLFFALFFYRRY